MSLEKEFATELDAMMDQSLALGGKPQAMRRKLNNRTGSAANIARDAMLQGTVHEGMVRMIKLGREDLTLEALVVKYAEKGLFSSEIRQCAEWRLGEGRRLSQESPSV